MLNLILYGMPHCMIVCQAAKYTSYKTYMAGTLHNTSRRSENGFIMQMTFLETFYGMKILRKVSNIRRTLVSNKIVDHSDVVGASPVGAAPTTSSFST